MSPLQSLQLLELNIISAQDLAPVSRKMKTYAVVGVHSDHKLTTRVDDIGGANPSWNDKFVFRINDEYLQDDSSAVVIEIYALHWFKDVHIGSVSVLISNLIPPNRRPENRTSNNEMRFMALQLRRTSGLPQGILNIGVGLHDGSMKSMPMPLYTLMDSSTVGYGELIGEEVPHLNNNKGSSKNQQVRPELRRTKSDTSSMVVSDLLSRVERSRLANRHQASAVVSSESETVPDTNDYVPPKETSKFQRRRYETMESNMVVKRRESSYHKPNKTPRRMSMNEKQRSVKDNNRIRASPYLSRHGTPLRSNIVSSTPIRSNVFKSTPMRSKIIAMSPMHPNMIDSTPMRSNTFGSTPMRSNKFGSTPMRSNLVELTPMQTPMRSNTFGSTPMRSNTFGSTPMRSNTFGSTPMRSNIVGSTPLRSNYKATPMKSNLAGRRILTNSELGPSPSEVAEKIAEERSYANETESSILNEWSVDESSIEGLRSKLQRWRTELPPVYDVRSSQVNTSDFDSSIVPAGGRSSRRKKTPVAKKHNRRHTDGGNGLFSCFSKICGVECSFICGGGGGGNSSVGSVDSKKGGAGRMRTYSADDLSSM